MNEAMMSTSAVRDLVKAECLCETNAFGPAFFDLHILPVSRYACGLARLLQADPVVVELAAYLHDLAAIRDVGCIPTHHVDSALIARDLLAAQGWPADVIEKVCRSIESHSAPVPLGQGIAEEVCLSNADVMSHIAQPAYWFYYLYHVRGMAYENGVSWLRTRATNLWAGLTSEARAMVGPEHAAAVQILERAASG